MLCITYILFFQRILCNLITIRYSHNCVATRHNCMTQLIHQSCIQYLSIVYGRSLRHNSEWVSAWALLFSLIEVKAETTFFTFNCISWRLKRTHCSHTVKSKSMAKDGTNVTLLIATQYQSTSVRQRDMRKHIYQNKQKVVHTRTLHGSASTQEHTILINVI